MPFKPPGQCPVCGEWVPRGAKACDDCGACAQSGWKDDAEIYDGLDLPEEEDFDYDAFIEKEFGTRASSGGNRKKTRSTPWWWWVALTLMIVLVLDYIISALKASV